MNQDFIEKIRLVMESKKVTYILWSVMIGVTVLLFVQSINCAMRAEGYDFTSYYLSAKALLNGTDPYDNGTIFPYVYPLTLAFLIIPLALLPYWLAVTLWFGVTVGMPYWSVLGISKTL